MHIVFFTRRFYPQIGGVEKHIMEIATRLITMGHKISVFSESIDGVADKEIYKNITIYRINVGENEKKKKWIIWKALFKFRHVLQSADIIHCHDVFFWYLPFRFMFPNKKVYTTFHGFEGYPIPQNAKKVRKISENLSNGNICVGKYLTKWYGTKATKIIYGAINPHSPIAAPKSNKIRIGFVGRLAVDTGIPVYLTALALMKQKKIAYEFIVYGDGPLKKEVQQYGKVHGFVTNPESIMKSVDVIFTASYLSSMEALQNKKSVISVYDNPLKKDILHMTPWAKWITITDDPKEVVNTLVKIQNNKKSFDTQKETTYKWVNMQTWDSLVSTYISLWKKN